jgi:ABC-type cobalamin/Fe3+-siderophores transport system ATPase subunit
MRLEFVSPYLSIEAFPSIDLPPFTVISGLNGVGKTHLLQAITQGKISVDIAPQESSIVSFNWTTLRPKVEDRQGNNWRASHRDAIDRVEREIASSSTLVFQEAASTGVPIEQYLDLRDLIRLDIAELTQLLGTPQSAETAKARIADAVSAASDQVLQQLSRRMISHDNSLELIQAAIERTGLPAIEIDPHVHLDDLSQSWGDVRFLTNALDLPPKAVPGVMRVRVG